MGIGLLVADDHDLVREAVGVLLSRTVHEIRIVAEAATAAAALRLARERSVQVALVDIEFPDGDGFQVLEQLQRQRPELPVLLHSTHHSPDYIARSRKLGACGYLVKGVNAGVLVEAIRAAHRREDVWRLLAAHMLAESDRSPS